MARNSAIEWTDHTFNPWIGCAKVSGGCAHCYAETLMDTRYGRVRWGVHGTRRRTSSATWRQPVSWNRAATRSGMCARVFCSSLADVFEDRPELESWRSDLWELVAATTQLEWLILTKRPENVLGMLPESWQSALPDHVRVGTSVEDQNAADARIPVLLRIPGRNFISAEPLLSPVFLAEEWLERVDWVIVGGESGPQARPMDRSWTLILRDQCVQAGVPFFFKQWGEWAPGGPGPDGSPQRRVGKKAAGRLLAGVEWSQFPAGR